MVIVFFWGRENGSCVSSHFLSPDPPPSSHRHQALGVFSANELSHGQVSALEEFTAHRRGVNQRRN